ncbi:MAG: hypothetical protein ACXWVS_10950 [Hyphomicrobium sp.]
MVAKLANPRFLLDIQAASACSAGRILTDEYTKESFIRVFGGFIERIPGDPWAREGNEGTLRAVEC